MGSQPSDSQVDPAAIGYGEAAYSTEPYQIDVVEEAGWNLLGIGITFSLAAIGLIIWGKIRRSIR